MRLVIDMQSAQSPSRFRGIGRYTRSLVQEMARQRGEHELLLVLNAAYADSIQTIRAAFAELLPVNAIHVFEVVGPVGGYDAANDARRIVGESMLDAFFSSLKPDVIFIPSLFEDDGNIVTSVRRLQYSAPIAVTLHDLIPLIYHGIYLSNSDVRRWYYNKIKHFRRADLFLSVSDASGREGVQHLNIPEHSVVTVANACDAHFQPIVLNETQRTHLSVSYGIDRPFVMAAGDTDARKNLEGLFRAFASLPEAIRSGYQLVLVGFGVFNRKDHFLNFAKTVGLQENELIFTGYVTDIELNLLYNACSLFVFPSWHEGFGLPVLEAMTCGRAVIAANSSSLPEVVGRQDALFAPRDDAAMSSKMAEVLGNAEFRQELERHGLEQANKFSWSVSASRAWDALSRLQAEHSARKDALTLPVTGRPKLAFVSPLPPAKTGIADYSVKLVPELARHYDITVVVEQETVCDDWVQANATIKDANWLRRHAREFDRVIYQMGNSENDKQMFALIGEVPGVLVLHNFFLSNALISCEEDQSACKNSWTKALYQSHGWSAVQEFAKQDDTLQLVMRWPCNLNVLQQALGVIVHSEFSRRLANQYYGERAADGWAVIPYLQQVDEQEDKSVVRKPLNLQPEDFVICSFVAPGDSKLTHRLLDAWLNSPLFDEANCCLVFVGENQDDDYVHNLTHKIAQSSAKDRIVITGRATEESYFDWLAAADMSVQLYSSSGGDISRTVLDCMNYGLPTIVNAHGSMAELPADSVWLLPDEFSDDQLIEAITTLWQDAIRRVRLGARARAHVKEHHNPRCCADQYAETIEVAYAQAEKTLFGLAKTLPKLKPALQIHEYPRLAEVLSANFPPEPRLPQLLLDVSMLIHIDLKTGIQRVTRALLEQILLNPPVGFRVEPVFATTDRSGYFYARKFTSRFLGLADDWAEDAPVQVWMGDKFLGLDFHPAVIPVQENVLNSWRNRGVPSYFIVHDLLPVLMPEVFPPDGSKEMHHRWLQAIARMDGAICVSQTVADEFYDWLNFYGEKRDFPFALYWSHSGADVANSSPSLGLPNFASRTLRSMMERPTFLMVGTIEPRKGYLQTLQAFDLLWAKGVDCNLVIVGKQGWKHLPDGDIRLRDIPQTIDFLRTHPENGKRLYWLEGISDEYLEKIYASSSCLLAASYGEGFGLPLIEAARHGLPLLVRDIPVFREASQGMASFFTNNRQPATIAESVGNWLHLYEKNKHPSSGVTYLTWEQSAQKVLNIVLGHTTPYRTWVYDGVHRYWGADPRLRTEIGKFHGTSVSTSSGAGYLIYGPYECFKAGRYRLTIHGSAEHWTGNEVIEIVCNAGQVIMEVFNLITPKTGQYQLEYEFSLKSICENMEIRLSVNEKSVLDVKGLKIECL